MSSYAGEPDAAEPIPVPDADGAHGYAWVVSCARALRPLVKIAASG